MESTNNWSSESPLEGISISTFNTLRKNYDFDGEYWVDEETRKWDTRLKLLKDVFIALNTDIICAQETETYTFEEDFQFMTECGYGAVKPVAKDEREHGHTKPSIFYKSARFRLTWHNPRSRTVLVQFQDKFTEKFFYVINCHLQGGTNSADQRLFQMRSALQQLQLHMITQKIERKNLACFICGDMNATSHDPVHSLLKNGCLSPEEIFKYGFKYSHDLLFRDALENVPANERYSFKSGVKADAFFQNIDYIYYTPKFFEVSSTRDPLSRKQREEMKDQIGIPNKWHPSDHLPVAAAFKIKTIC
jgi:mRNA deadenylase 3'-5' endonuclease subunit Ccr4